MHNDNQRPNRDALTGSSASRGTLVSNKSTVMLDKVKSAQIEYEDVFLCPFLIPGTGYTYMTHMAE